jgi:hypothetical protein
MKGRLLMPHTTFARCTETGAPGAPRREDARRMTWQGQILFCTLIEKTRDHPRHFHHLLPTVFTVKSPGFLSTGIIAVA